MTIDASDIINSRSRTMVSQHIEQSDGVHYVQGIRISLDSIVYASVTDRPRRASAKISRD